MRQALHIRLGRMEFAMYPQYVLVIILMALLVGFDLYNLHNALIFLEVFAVSCVLRIMGYSLGAYVAGFEKLTINFTASGLILKYSDKVDPINRVFLHMIGLILPVILALFALLMMYLTAEIHLNSGISYNYLWQSFAAVNLGLFLFNLLPILPNDGAYLLREFGKTLDKESERSFLTMVIMVNRALIVLWIPMICGFFLVLGFFPLFVPIFSSEFEARLFPSRLSTNG